MKKVLAGILTAVLVLSLSTVSVLAAGPGCGRNFVDADGDGVCDYAGSHCRYTDENGDGICDNCGALAGACGGQNFVDADGDGVCDNYAAGGCGAGMGRGFHGGCHR